MAQPLNTKRIDQLPLASLPYDGASLLAAAVPQGGGLYTTFGLTLAGIAAGILPDGVLPVVSGGTGLNSLTTHGLLVGQGTSTLAVTAAMSNGQLLVGQTSADPLPKTLSGDATLAASGALTLASVVAGATNTKITYNAKGLVTAGTAAAASDFSNGTTGSGAIVLANTPTLVTPVLGAATGTSLNLSGLTASSAVATDASKNLVSVNIGEYVASIGAPAGSTVTITIASPAVITWTGSPYTAGRVTTGTNWTSPIVFTTTGALPTGLTAGTVYWVIGSSVSGNNFSVATSLANALAGTAVTTTGSQSGVQTGTPGNPLTSAVSVDVGAIQLTAGTWMIWGEICSQPGAGTTVSVLTAWIGTASATSPGAPNGGAFYSSTAALAANAAPRQPVGMISVQLAATTTFYLSISELFAVSTSTGFGFLAAFRLK